MASYEEYYKKLIEQEKQSADERYQNFAAENDKTTDEYLTQVAKTYELSREQAQKETDSSIAKLEADYQSAYDANAVNAKLQERQIAEAMANTGLSDSGLNRTQQTAVRIAQMNGDNALTQQQTAARNSLIAQLDAFNQESRIQQLQNEGEVKYNAAQQKLSYRQQLDDNAQSTAQSTAAALYNTDVEAETEKTKAKLEAETENTKAYYSYLSDSEKQAASAKTNAYNNAYNALKQGYTNAYNNGGYTETEKYNAFDIIAGYLNSDYGATNTEIGQLCAVANIDPDELYDYMEWLSTGTTLTYKEWVEEKKALAAGQIEQKPKWDNTKIKLTSEGLPS